MKSGPRYSGLQSITVAQAQANLDYWRVFANIYRTQATLFIQRKWRLKKGLPPSRAKFKETLIHHPAKLMQFIREPHNPTLAMQFAEHIHSGNWLKLDYHHPEFERHIYKALRLALINSDQLALALFLYHAQIQFDYPLQQHRFDAPGPCVLRDISYATPKMIQDFQRRLKKLPQADQCYFSVNLSQCNEAMFLYDRLMQMSTFKEGLATILKAFLARLSLDHQTLARYQQAIKNLSVGTLLNEARTTLCDLIKSHYKQYAAQLDYTYVKNGTPVGPVLTMHHCSQFLLSAIYEPDPQLPMVVVSSDFDVTNPNSPLLCVLIPTMPAFEALQDAVHGEANTVEPYFTAGQISLRLFRELDENPQLFGKKRQSRPVELPHPDLIANPSPHNWGTVHSFVLSWHDIFHCWQGGMITNKPFIRYLRALLIKETGFEMSQAIWRLTDMDIPPYLQMRNNEVHQSDVPLKKWIKTMTVSFVLNLVAKNIWENADAHDLNLLLMIDMIIHHQKWTTEFLPNMAPEQAFKMKGTNNWDGIIRTASGVTHHYFYNKNLANFQHTFRVLKQLMQQYRRNGELYPIKFYILAYRLRLHPKGLALSQQLADIGFEKHLAWTRNGGLCLLDGNHHPLIERVNTLDIVDKIQSIIQESIKAKKVTSAQPGKR